MAETQACAHRRVSYRTEPANDDPEHPHAVPGYWQCDSCPQRFWPVMLLEAEHQARLALEETITGHARDKEAMERNIEELTKQVEKLSKQAYDNSIAHRNKAMEGIK